MHALTAASCVVRRALRLGGSRACDSCLALWHGSACDVGDVFAMPKTDDPVRARRLPAQFTGDVLMNKRQLAASGPEIKVHLPGKNPPWRTIAKAKDAVDLVPARDLVGKKYATCAIVGNSGMLVYSRNGAEIDAHEMVMRFNGAPTKGLEDRVGSKTTFRLVNSKWTEFREFKEEIILWNMRGVGAFEDFQLRRKTHGKSEQFHILSADFVNYVGEMAFQLSNSFVQSDESNPDPDEASLAASAEGFNSGDYTPTSGWTGLILAASVCGKITLYGMQVSEEQGVPYHYHNRCPQPYSARDTAEWLMFRRFVHAGIATFKEPCIEVRVCMSHRVASSPSAAASHAFKVFCASGARRRAPARVPHIEPSSNPVARRATTSRSATRVRTGATSAARHTRRCTARQPWRRARGCGIRDRCLSIAWRGR